MRIKQSSNCFNGKKKIPVIGKNDNIRVVCIVAKNVDFIVILVKPNSNLVLKPAPPIS